MQSVTRKISERKKKLTMLEEFKKKKRKKTKVKQAIKFNFKFGGKKLKNSDANPSFLNRFRRLN